jgi:hypothetical protein
VVGRLSVPQGISIFEETCDKCHLPTITQREQGTYCFSCHCMVSTSSKARVLCKITGPKGDIYECIVSGPWIMNLLGCEVKSPEDFKASRGKYLRAFNIAKPEGTFVLNPSTEVVSFRPEDAQISEAMSQFINDDVVADLNLEHEISLLQPYRYLGSSYICWEHPYRFEGNKWFWVVQSKYNRFISCYSCGRCRLGERT